MRGLKLLGSLAAVAVAWSMCAASALGAESAEYELKIEKQPLGTALQEFSKQSGLQVVFLSKVTDGIEAPAVKGKFTAETALQRLLDQSPLMFRELNSNTFAVQRRAKEASTSSLQSPSSIVGGNRSAGEALQLAQSESASEGSTQSSSLGTQLAQSQVQTGPEVNQPQEGKLEEIIVTAEKRSERLLDAPSSITVLSGQQLELTEPKSLVDLNGYIPGLTVTSGGSPGQTQLTLRGIAAQVGFGALVGTYIDEVPVGSSSAQIRGAQYSPDLMPYDLERIEVLSGPQGTLYGASTMGGLLKYVLKDPELTEFSARVGAVTEYIHGSGDLGAGARASVDIPLINDIFGIRISGFDQKTQGYISNVGLDQEHYNSFTQQGGRLAGLWKVTDTLTVKFSALFQNINSAGNSSVAVDPTTLQPLYGDYAESTRIPETFTQRAQLYTLVTDWNLGFASLISASGWQSSQINQVYDTSAIYAPYVGLFPGGAAYPNPILPYIPARSLDKFTEEIRLASPTGQRYEWMLGTFYTHESTQNNQPVYALDASGQEIPGFNPFFNSTAPWAYDEVAAFANGTIRFNEQFAVTAGARYAENHQSNSSTEYGALLGSITSPLPSHFSSHQGVATWMISPQWHLTKDSMLYARVATGYRPGGWTYTAPPAPQTFRADTLTNYEMGFKSNLLDNRLLLTVALYDIQWQNIQENVLDLTTHLSYLGNGGTARSRGVEGEITYAVTEGLRVGATVGYTDARLTEDAPGIGGLSGDPLPLTATWNGALTIDYLYAISGNRAWSAGAAFRYSSALWDEVEHSSAAVLTHQPRPLDLYAGMHFGRIDTRVYLRNVFNSEPSIGHLEDLAYWTANNGPLTYVAIPPRTIGLSFDLKL